MDFFRTNGQVLAQLYGYKAIKSFRTQLNFGDEDGYIIELYFFKAKTNNCENERRFLLSDYYSMFKQFEGIEPKGAYFSFLKSDISDEYFGEFLEEMLRTIYGSDVQIEIKVHG